MISVNRHSIPIIELIGEDNIPVIIIDDYANNHGEIINQVSNNGNFDTDNITSYPGIRSSIPKDLVVSYLKPLMKGIFQIYNVPKSLKPSPKDNYFSLITAKPSELTPIQSWPHFDTPNPNLLAVIHYLGKGEHGGIGFFEHKKSGFIRIDKNNKEYFYQCADDYFNSSDAKAFGYCQEQHSEFSCYKKIAYKSNRLIIFPGQLLHSTLVNIDTDIDSNPSSGRLTANMFVFFK